MASTLLRKPALGFLGLVLALAPLTNTNASGATTATTAAAIEAPEAILQKALVSEEARRDLPAAIAAYEQVVRSVDDQRRLAATAVFRLGECYRKSGRTNDAVAQYQRILRDFAAEEVLARLSRQNLTALGTPIPAPPSFLPATGNAPALTGSPAPTGNPVAATSAGRAEQLKLLDEEIALLEKEHQAAKRRFENGVADQKEIWALERELLQLKRQQVALRDAPIRRDLPDLPVPAPAANAAGSSPTGPTAPPELERLIARIAEFEQRSPKETGALAAFQEAFPDTELANLQKKIKDTESRLSSLQSNTDDNASEISSAESELGSLRSRRQARWDAVLAEQRERAQAIGRNTPAGAPGTADLSPADAAEIARLRALIQQSPDLLNAPTGDPYMAPLHRAAANGQLAVVRFLLDQGAEVNNARSSQNWTALHHAASKGHKAVVELLLDRGADPDAPARDGSTALHLAVNREYREVVRTLLSRGAQVDARGWTGGGYRTVQRGNVITSERDTAFTPLHLAAQQALTNFVSLLLAAGADVNAANSFQRTPLHLAIEARHTATVTRLLEAKADPNRADASGRTPLQEVLDPASRTSPPSLGGGRGSDLELVRLLLSAGADPNGRNPGGATPLLVALSRPPGLNPDAAYLVDTNLVAALLSAGADVNGRISVPEHDYDDTPLAQAVLNRDLASAQVLLEAGAQPNITLGNAAETPLHRAVQNRQKAMVELLLARGADPTLRNRAGLTAEDLVNPKPRTSETVAIQTTSPNAYLSGIPVFPPTPGIAQAIDYATLPQRTRPGVSKPSGPSSDVELAELFRARAPASTGTNAIPSTNAAPASPGQ